MRADLYEDKDDLVLKAELPGVGKDRFDVRLEGDMLRIETEKKVGEQTRERTYLSERDFGGLSRTLSRFRSLLMRPKHQPLLRTGYPR